MKLKLYISGQLCEFFSDESVILKSSIKEVGDIEKVYTDYSRNFSLPYCPANNKIFKHYYNNKIISTDFRKKVAATLTLNDAPYKTGFIQLVNMPMVNNLPTAYNVVFFGGNIQIKDILREDKLQDLNLAEYNHLFNETNVIAGIKTSVTSGLNGTIPDYDIIYPLLSRGNRYVYDSVSGGGSYATGTSNIYYQNSTQNRGVVKNDLKPAIKILRLIDAIKVKYPSLNFSDTFFNASNAAVANLYMWLSRYKYPIGYTDNKVTVSAVTSGYTSSGTSVTTLDSIASIFSFDTYFEYGNYVIYTLVLDVTPTGSERYDVKIEDIEKGTTILEITGISGLYNTSLTLNDGYELTPSSHSIRLTISSSDSLTGFTADWEITKSQPFVSDIEYLTATNSLNVSANISETISDMTVIDFIKGLYSRFNLVSYVTLAGVIEILPLDDYYTATEIDISSYIDVSVKNIGVPPVYNGINYVNNKPKSLLAKNFLDQNSIAFGDLKYITSLEGPNNTVKTPFELCIFERLIDIYTNTDTNIGYSFICDVDYKEVIPSCLLFYNVPTHSTVAKPFAFINGTTTNSITSYNRPCNAITGASSSFGLETNEYTKTMTPEADSLFTKYHKTYIQRIFNKQQRVVKVKAILPFGIIYKLKLSNVIVINEDRYRINMMDINLMTGETKLDLTYA